MPDDAPRLLAAMLRALAGRRSPFPVDDFDHSLQTATRAERAGADDEWIVAALCHDAAKALLPAAPGRHGPLAAEILRPYVRDEVAWVIRVHEDFTPHQLGRGLERYARLRHRLSPWYAAAARFVDEWDCPARDPAYPTLPLEHFEPVLARVLGHARPARSRSRRAVEAATRWLSPAQAARMDRAARALKARLRTLGR